MHDGRDHHWQASVLAQMKYIWNTRQIKWVHQCLFLFVFFEQNSKMPMLKCVLDIYQLFEISIRIWINSRIHLYFVSDKSIVLFARTPDERVKEIEPKTHLIVWFFKWFQKYTSKYSVCVCVCYMSKWCRHSQKLTRRKWKHNELCSKMFYCLVLLFRVY